MVELPNQLGAQIAYGQSEDPVIREAKIQLRATGQVTQGKFRKVSNRLRLRDGLLFFKERLVVPKVLQQEILEFVHSEGTSR